MFETNFSGHKKIGVHCSECPPSCGLVRGVETWSGSLLETQTTLL